jgi:serine/threonine-protein kinase
VSDEIINAVDEPGGLMDGNAIAVGDVLDGIYRLDAVLGAGAMGRIFAAQDLILQRSVAVKVPLDEAAREVLVSEARALAALRHRHLPVIHAAGRHRGIDFLVMERLSGVDLDKYISAAYASGHSLPLAEALELLSVITQALLAIHHAGIAHRDIKPENVLLCKRGPVLIDFGLVAAASSTAAVDGGSPCYVPPELVLRKSERSTRHLSDIYSLGVLAYELLSGKVPFDADDVRELLVLHVQAPIPDVRALRPDVPAKLAALLLEMMAKEPSERPTAEEVSWRLQGVARALRKPDDQPAVLIVSGDMGFCGKIGRLVQGWVPGARIRSGRTADAALAVIAKDAPRLMLVDMADASGVELLMQWRGSEQAHTPATVAVVKDFHTTDLSLLKRMAVFCVVHAGETMIGELSEVVTNVLRPRT